MVIFGIFLIAFLFVFYKAMTHDPERLAEERFEEYWDEQEKEEQKNGQ